MRRISKNLALEKLQRQKRKKDYIALSILDSIFSLIKVFSKFENWKSNSAKNNNKRWLNQTIKIQNEKTWFRQFFEISQDWYWRLQKDTSEFKCKEGVSDCFRNFDWHS